MKDGFGLGISLPFGFHVALYDCAKNQAAPHDHVQVLTGELVVHLRVQRKDSDALVQIYQREREARLVFD